MTPGADRAFDIRLHEKLQNRLGDRAKKISLIMLLQKLGKDFLSMPYNLCAAVAFPSTSLISG